MIDKLVALLASHQLLYSFRRGDDGREEQGRCVCGWEGPWLPDRERLGVEPDTKAFTAHVAAAIREAGVVEIDRKAEAAYVRVFDAPVSRTVEVGEHRQVYVDLDSGGGVVGVEVLTLPEGCR